MFLPHVHRLDIENANARAQQAVATAAAGKKKGKRQAAERTAKGKISREAKVIPRLIFEIEQYERHLIKLAQITKVCPGRFPCATRPVSDACLAFDVCETRDGAYRSSCSSTCDGPLRATFASSWRN